MIMAQANLLIIGHSSLNRIVAKWWESQDVKITSVDGDQRLMNDQLDGIDYVFDTLTGPTEKKRKLIQYIDSQVSLDTPIFTSILHHSATEMSSWCKETTRTIGFHPLQFDEMKVLELAPALQTSQGILEKAVQFLEGSGKKIEKIQDEVAGVLPRTLALLINEATHALSEEIATAEDIDIAMKKGTNYPLGLLEWADRVGLDQILWILEGLQRDFGDDRYRPAPLLRKKVMANQLGLATGQGFYSYE